MLIIFLFFALIQTLHGVPLTSQPSYPPDPFTTLALRDRQRHFDERTVSDIIISCFATIFACTWSAVHPNIPAPTDCVWTRFKRQLVTMVYALLAPEAITAWALRQRLAARKIADRYNGVVAKGISEEMQESSLTGIKRTVFQNSSLPHTRKDNEVLRWTLAHGFFFQMGGFMLSEGGRPIQTLNTFYEEKMGIAWNIEKRVIDPPLITEEDIKDRSKGDVISKTLIIFQTTWFIAQCIARWSCHLPVTELEVVTLGFAMLNGLTYGLWWQKPQNVGRPVFLEIKCETRQGGPGNMSFQEKTTDTLKKNPWREAQTSQTATISKPSHLWYQVCEDFGDYASHKPWKLLYLTPLRFVQGLLRPLGKLADYDPLHRFIEPGDLRVRMFYSRAIDSSAVYGITAIIGVVFGLVHLIPSWFFDFASVQEKWLWRVSAIVITVGPVFLGFAQFERHSTFKNTSGLLLIMALPLYIISRIILLTLSLTSLRSLPPPALQTIKWTTFIPHI